MNSSPSGAPSTSKRRPRIESPLAQATTKLPSSEAARAGRTPALEAAAISTSLGWLAMAIVLYTLSQRRFAISYDWPTIAWFGVMAALFVIAGNMAQTLPALTRLGLIVLLSLAFPLLGLMVLLRSRDERGRMLLLLSKFRALQSNR